MEVAMDKEDVRFSFLFVRERVIIYYTFSQMVDMAEVVAMVKATTVDKVVGIKEVVTVLIKVLSRKYEY